MMGIQHILQTHPRAAVVLYNCRLWDVVFYISFDTAVKAQHVIQYLVAVHAGDVTQAQGNLWLQLLRIESYVDFSCPLLWRVLYPGRELPPSRRA